MFIEIGIALIIAMLLVLANSIEKLIRAQREQAQLSAKQVEQYEFLVKDWLSMLSAQADERLELQQMRAEMESAAEGCPFLPPGAASARLAAEGQREPIDIDGGM